MFSYQRPMAKGVALNDPGAWRLSCKGQTGLRKKAAEPLIAQEPLGDATTAAMARVY
jgi:hypothetical protein